MATRASPRQRGNYQRLARHICRPNKGVAVGEKSPNQRNDKKVGKSLKEKRNDKNAKKTAKSGLLEPKK